MSMIAITGLQGSGKSMQAVKYVILPNCLAGRRILTNIKGIDQEKVHEYLHKKYPEKDVSEFGDIVNISDADINKANFYPYLDEVDHKEVVRDSDSIVKSGDCVVIDEAAQFYFGKLDKKHLIYFTMHRHFTNEKTGLSTELCFLVQDVSLLPLPMKKLLKNTYTTKKLDALGFAKSYKLKIFDSFRTDDKYIINSSTERYDKEIFPMYASHAGGKGKEKNLDKRASIFKNTGFILFLLAFTCLIPYTYFHLKNKWNPPKVESNTTNINNPIQGATNNLSSPIQEKNGLRIVGVMDTPNKRLIYLLDENNNLKLSTAQQCTGSGLSMTCKIDNKEVSYYSHISKPENTNEKNNNNNSNSIK